MFIIRRQSLMGVLHFCLSCNKAEVSTGFIPQHLCSKMFQNVKGVFRVIGLGRQTKHLCWEQRASLFTSHHRRALFPKLRLLTVTQPTVRAGITRQVLFSEGIRAGGSSCKKMQIFWLITTLGSNCPLFLTQESHVPASIHETRHLEF